MTETLIERRARLLGPNMSTFYTVPVHLVRGQGVWLWDADGRQYLDCYNNVPHVGHCHPRVVEAICRQAGTLNTHTRYLHEGILDYVEALTATFEAPFDTALMCCTGSEANDVALCMAQALTGKTGVIATDHTYHGNTTAVHQLSQTNPPPGGYWDSVAFVPAPDSYRPLGAVDAMATLRVVQDEGLQANAADVGAYAPQGLRDLATRHEAIGDVRGAGLFFGAEMVLDKATKTPATAHVKALPNGLRQRGVLLNFLGIHYNVLKIRPPMPFSRANVDHLIETLDAVMAETPLA